MDNEITGSVFLEVLNVSGRVKTGQVIAHDSCITQYYF